MNQYEFIKKTRNARSIFIFLSSFILTSILLISLASSQDSLGTFKQGNCIDIKQTCSSCSYVNLSVAYPNSTRIIINKGMNNAGGGTWNYSFCNTSFIGRYEVVGEGDIDGTAESFATYFEISPSGSKDMTSGAGLSLLGSLFIIILVGGFLFVLSFRIDNPTFKFSFIVLSSIVLLIAVFYSMVMVQQNLGGFDNIISGYSTFFTVLKIFSGISLTGLFILSILISIRYYKFKRGLID